MKITSLTTFVVAAMLFLMACNKEPKVDLTDDWQDITVVYGLLDRNDTAHYLRISKAFLGTGNLYNYAAIQDSIYYPDILDVKIEEYEGSSLKNTFTLQRVVNEIPKDSGLFAFNDNVLYKFTQTLNPNRTYKLKITNTQTGKVVTAQTNIVNNVTVNRPANTQQISLFNNTGIAYDFKSEVTTGRYAQRIEAYVRFEFWEHTATDSALKSVTMSIGSHDANSDVGGVSLPAFILNGDVFIETLKSKLPNDPNIVKRTFKSEKLNTTNLNEMFFTYYSADKFLTTYIDVNKPSNSIVQEKPDYTNIENGIGVFASRNTYTTIGNRLQLDTRNKIKTVAELKFQ